MTHPVAGRWAPNTRRLILASTVDNALEWYDFGIYGYLASIFTAKLFLGDDPAEAVLSVLGVFVTGFVMRCLGCPLYRPIGVVLLAECRGRVAVIGVWSRTRSSMLGRIKYSEFGR